MMANGVYAMSAITALTAQNTTKVADIMEVTPQFLAEQLDCIFTEGKSDIVRNMLPVFYRPDTPKPVLWLSFLNGCLLYTSRWV